MTERVYPESFYASDPLDVAPGLLGSLLIHRRPGHTDLVGRIVETEAYRGEEDLACHAKAGLTKRTEVLYGPPGRAYVYLIYGMYHMLNVVAWPKGRPAAVLIRALEPVSGIARTTDGPGKLARAMGLDMSLNRTDLREEPLFIVPAPQVGDIATGPRVGVDYAGEWASRPWRFAVRGNPHVSKAGRLNGSL